MRHHPIELGQHIALQIDVARVFHRKVDRDGQRLGKLRELICIGNREGITAILSDVDRCLELRHEKERDRRGANAKGRAHQLLPDCDARRQPDRCQSRKAADGDGHARNEADGKKSLLECANDLG